MVEWLQKVYQKRKKLGVISQLIDGQLNGNSDIDINGVASIEEVHDGEITVALDRKRISRALLTDASAIIIPKDCSIPAEKPTISTENPKLAFAKVLKLFSPHKEIFSGIHPTAIIDSGVSMGENVSINPYVVIEDGTKIGNGIIIYPFVYIGKSCEIGNNSIIYSHVFIMEGTKIGNDVIIHPNVTIGSDGFGYVDIGYHYKIPQIGYVRIENNVEIGAGTTIDRGTTHATIIGEGTKIDNLVQIAHNVKIGKHCIIAASAAIAGSAVLKDHVTLAGQVGVGDHVTIEEGTIVAGRAGVTKNIKNEKIISGFPARPHDEEKRLVVLRGMLPELLNRIKNIEEKLK